MTAAISVSANMPAWQRATWEEYEHYRDKFQGRNQPNVFFNIGYLKVDNMGWEGMSHSQVRELFGMIFTLWFMAHPEQEAELMGGCLLEKSEMQAASPDLMVYLGEDAPRWQEGEPRRIDLARWRLPDLVGEVADRTLASDLDEMKQLYAAMGIPEYWVINVKASQVWVFRLVDGKYQQCETSGALAGLSIDLLEKTLERLAHGTNVKAANWFMGELARWQL
jgi:Uma2 family endonuclease